MSVPQSNRIGELVRGLLDRGYERATAATLRAISSSVSSGVVAQRLRELEAEAARLQAAGERMQADNPVLRALVADLEPVLQRDAARIDVGATDTQESGVSAAQTLTRELALFDNEAARRLIQARWNVPDPEAVNAVVEIVNNEGWAAEIRRYPSLVLETVQNQAIRGVVEGWNPTRTAREIRRMTQGVTVAQANTLMRTVQLHSYRRATAIHQLANRDILQEQIRVATLDRRTCLACIALHGTRYPIGVAIPDHWNGRCTSVSVITGVPRNIRTGEEWLTSLSEEQQRRIMGDANFYAWRDGEVRIQDFVNEWQDQTFGAMVNERSLKGILGDGARKYYTR
jgi:hypothetical protein